ncbi:uncharacterized protein BJ171DRAFT_487618 [Polychytrium aggregatum]|uniref:uncharacterized protein n=1 Tax=Polychytrium aggregatum TaxID=110093 RepID=UPI0022FE519B|nr:uncharacterized protein BJ171DRAFT_487618 [Polychytrium aggregatum]KAI9208899.1 hypothetical protein BJ171DRAFT_487618 [Polychytrium aggregatum]
MQNPDAYDWYISPADRFNYETQFTRNNSDDVEITLQQMENIYNTSRISLEDFQYIWNLVNIRGNQAINKEQFVVFLHVLNSKRRGKPFPTGLTLSMKESFLKEDSKPSDRMYVRPSTSTRDVASFENKDIAGLEASIQELDREMTQSRALRDETEKRIAELKIVKAELADLAEFKRKHLAAIKADNEALLESEKVAVGGRDLDETSLLLLIDRLKEQRRVLEIKKSTAQAMLTDSQLELTRAG